MSEDDDWCAIDLENKLNKKIDTLQNVVQQQHELLQQMSSSIQTLKEELHRTHQSSSHLSQRHDRTHELLEELKIMKHRELNMALREKVAVPFCSERHLGYGTRPTIVLSPYFLGRRLASPSHASFASFASATSATSATAATPTPFSL
jgi:ABC-type glutathione transport system ATPase component